MLELPEDASTADIKNSYRRLAMRYHPDKAKGEEGDNGETFKKINSAYQTLSDPHKKAEYDLVGDGMFPSHRIGFPRSCNWVTFPRDCVLHGDMHTCITLDGHIPFDDDDELGCFNARSAEDFFYGGGYHFFSSLSQGVLHLRPDSLSP